MSKTYGQQFDEAMACETREQAAAWMNVEVARYATEFGKDEAEARHIILANLGYMAGYYDAAHAKKVHELFGAVHPIFGTSDYHGKVTPEQAMQAGKDEVKR